MLLKLELLSKHPTVCVRRHTAQWVTLTLDNGEDIRKDVTGQ